MTIAAVLILLCVVAFIAEAAYQAYTSIRDSKEQE
jgi:hypothetical protein